jgi:sialate O-acetylesterase
MVLVTACAASALAEVTLPPVISSHMVLQRDATVPIWGTAAPGEKVSVKFRAQEKSATADGSGKWLVKLDPLAVGDPDTLTISGRNTLTLADVLVGDVWVGSGQSNMDMPVSSYTKNDPVLEQAAANSYPQIRLIRAGWTGWQEATPENNAKMSALLFAFGVPLGKELKAPVGLLAGAVGGTPSGYWLSEEAYRSDEACKQVVAKFAADYSFEDAEAKAKEALARWEKEMAVAKKDGKRPPRKPASALRPGECNAKVGHLYEARIRPFQPFAIRGVLWDQGESGTAICGVDQYTLMGALIRGWRKEWGQGDFPFLYVQKPSGIGCALDPADPLTKHSLKFTGLPKQVPSDGQYVETHIRIMNYPNTAMVTSMDLGPGVHPVSKSSYGVRAARVALGLVYGQKGEIYGPVYQSHTVEGNKVRVTYSHVGQGLVAGNGARLQGFALAGEDKKYFWADSLIEGNAVVLACKDMARPVAVRYAWAQTCPWANLFNKDGLPTIPFRTDSW